MAALSVRMLKVGLVSAVLVTVYNALNVAVVQCLLATSALYTLYRWERKRCAGTISLTGKYVLITGCDTGFGFGLAKQLFGIGCHVVATVLQPEGAGAQELQSFNSPRMTVLPLDVSSDESVSAFLKRVQEICCDTGLWGLVNNAGFNMFGPAELVLMRQYIQVANVNLFGMIRCTRAFLPLVRKAKGRVVNVTSVRGRVYVKNIAPYAISKHGAETFSDHLRIEMKRFGVKVIVIEPGNLALATSIQSEELLQSRRKNNEDMWAEASKEVQQAYPSSDPRLPLHIKAPVQGPGPKPSMTPVIYAMTEALTSGDPMTRYLIDGSGVKIDKNCVRLFSSALWVRGSFSDVAFLKLYSDSSKMLEYKPLRY